MRLLQPCNRPCARRQRKGRARPGLEAAQAALVTLASRPHGLRPVRATVCEPPGASPPARVRPGAPSLGLARYARHTGVVRHGAARRAVRPRQVVTAFPRRPGGWGRFGEWPGGRASCAQYSPFLADPPFFSAEGPLCGLPARAAV